MAIDPKDISIHDEMVVETEIDGAPVGLPAFVTNILAEELWLATRLPEPRLVGMSAGQPVHLAFGAGGGLIVESVFLRRLGHDSKLGMEKSRVFAVRRPQGVDTVQRRAHARVDLERTVRIKALGSLGHEQMGNGKTTNIGAGGVQFLTDMPLLFGEQLRIALVLTSRDIVVAGGVIVRIEDGDPHPPDSESAAGSAGPSKFSKVAVRFDKVSEADQERITCHILAAHRQRSKPNSLKPMVSQRAETAVTGDQASADASIAETAVQS
ncbi:MAG TPA: PilZ domain-containing protein [Candidatus Limnocylindrales bacterium]